jgi:hypothetical protein
LPAGKTGSANFHEIRSSEAERLVVEGLQRMGWSGADLEARRQGEPRKAELAFTSRTRRLMLYMDIIDNEEGGWLN